MNEAKSDESLRPQAQVGCPALWLGDTEYTPRWKVSGAVQIPHCPTATATVFSLDSQEQLLILKIPYSVVRPSRATYACRYWHPFFSGSPPRSIIYATPESPAGAAARAPPDATDCCRFYSCGRPSGLPEFPSSWVIYFLPHHIRPNLHQPEEHHQIPVRYTSYPHHHALNHHHAFRLALLPFRRHNFAMHVSLHRRCRFSGLMVNLLVHHVSKNLQ